MPLAAEWEHRIIRVLAPGRRAHFRGAGGAAGSLRPALGQVYWPEPVPDQFDIVVTAAAGADAADTADQQKALASLSSSSSSDADLGKPRPYEAAAAVSAKASLSRLLEGRPTADKVFEDARRAAEPGTFMCGPTALTRMGRAEAAKENSYRELTRCCLHDEPYEM
jgi:hypothetical protein